MWLIDIKNEERGVSKTDIFKQASIVENCNKEGRRAYLRRKIIFPDFYLQSLCTFSKVCTRGDINISKILPLSSRWLHSRPGVSKIIL